MKVKLNKQQVNDLKKGMNPYDKVEISSPWWVILLKVIAYAIGLILAGYGSAQAATLLM